MHFRFRIETERSLYLDHFLDASHGSSGESASGKNLLRVLLERRYGVHPEYVDETHPLERARAGDAVLLIGDSAIDAIQSLPRETIYDLGTLWHEWTRRQTVFAVWAARNDLPARASA